MRRPSHVSKRVQIDAVIRCDGFSPNEILSMSMTLRGCAPKIVPLHRRRRHRRGEIAGPERTSRRRPLQISVARGRQGNRDGERRPACARSRTRSRRFHTLTGS